MIIEIHAGTTQFLCLKSQFAFWLYEGHFKNYTFYRNCATK